MRNLVSVLLAFAVSTPVLAQTHSYSLTAIDSVSVNPTSGSVPYRDNLVRVSTDLNNPTLSDLNGLLKFDVSSIPDCEVITGLTLQIQLDLNAPNPFGGPRVKVHHSTDDTWTRQSASGSSGAPANLVSSTITLYPGPGGVLSTSLDVSNYDFAADLLDDRITLVLDNTNVLTSRVTFVGPAGTPVATPPPTLNITTSVPAGCGCTGIMTASGTGCSDSGGLPVDLSISGCPKLGDAILLSTTTSPGVSGPAFDVLGISDSSWMGIGLPLSLAVLGAPGCSLHVSQEVMIGPLSGSGGTVSAFAPIPPIPVLGGARLFIQSLVIDLPANSLGLVTSGYWDITIGT